jgi:hypothetical protein
MQEGATTHPDNDWVGRSPDYHLGRAEEHLRLWSERRSAAGPCVPCSDAVADGLNLTTAGVIREYRRNLPQRLIKQRGVMPRCR